jgi:hypothetical protein
VTQHGRRGELGNSFEQETAGGAECGQGSASSVQESASGWCMVREEVTGAAIGSPARWERLDPPPAPAVLVVAADAVPAGRFRVNVAVTVEAVPPQARDLRVYSPAVVEGFLTLPNAYVLAVDVFPFRLRKDLECLDNRFGEGLDVRRMLGVYRQGDFSVVLTQYWTIVDGVATAVSASCAVEDYRWFEPIVPGFLTRFQPAITVPGVSE